MQEKRYGSRCFSVDCMLHLHIRVLLTTSIRRCGISVPRFFCLEFPFVVLKRELKVAPDTDLGNKKMKKILLQFVIFMFCTTSVSFAGNYEKSIEINGGTGLDKFSKYSFGIEMINGYRFNNYFSIGFGAGFRYTKALYYSTYEHLSYQSSSYKSFDGKYLIPLHARVKANLSSAKVSPFLMLDGGYTIDVGQNKNKNTEGIFIEPAFGVDIKLDEKNSMYLGVGVNFQNAHYEFFSIGGYSGSYVSVENGMASTLNFRIGFVF